jgi:glycosyltransferase involved in cell wall biosynthesis
MACELPIIAFNCPYGPADILSDRRGGVLVKPRDVSGLARTIDNLLAAPDERQSLIAAGQISIGRFSLPRIVAKYADLIEQLAEKQTSLRSTRYAQA